MGGADANLLDFHARRNKTVNKVALASPPKMIVFSDMAPPSDG